MQIIQEVKLDFSDVLIKPNRSNLSSRANVNITREFKFLHSKKTWTGVPVVAANMDSVGTFEMSNALRKEQMSVALHKFYNVEQLISFMRAVPDTERQYVWYTIGANDADVDKLSEFNKQMPIDFLCIDVANGYSQQFIDFVKRMRDRYVETTIMAGNIATSDIAYDLIRAGADILKVGVGPGSACSTRMVTGVGYPQLSAIIECAEVAHHEKAHICADGGCKTPGDIAKAFAAGADFVMIGGMLAGHDESGGELVGNVTLKSDVDIKINRQNDTYTLGDLSFDIPTNSPINKLPRVLLNTKNTKIRYYGMSSEDAQVNHYGGVSKHRAPEGVTVEIDYRGPVSKTVQEILGGIRSACTYVGAEKLKHLSKKTTFVRVNQQHGGRPGQEIK